MTSDEKDVQNSLPESTQEKYDSIELQGESLDFEAAKEFIGPRYDWYWERWKAMAKKESSISWNWAAALGSVWWLGFRKMNRAAYSYIGIVFAACLIAGIASGGNPEALNLAIGLIGLVSFLIMGLFGNLLYWRHSAKTTAAISRRPVDGAMKQTLLDSSGDLSVPRGLLAGFATLIVASVALVLSSAITFSTASPCRIANISQEADVFFVNGEVDAGWRVDAVIQNEGPSATLLIEAVLSTSEGDFVRRQTLLFGENQRFDLNFDFHEPTITADNVQARIGCSLSR